MMSKAEWINYLQSYPNYRDEIIRAISQEINEIEMTILIVKLYQKDCIKEFENLLYGKDNPSF